MKRIIKLKEETKEIVFDLLEKGYEILVEDNKNIQLIEEHFGDRLEKNFGFYKLKNKKPYIIRDKQTKTEFEYFNTLEEAQNCMHKFIEDDKIFKIFKPRFYEIYNMKTKIIEEVSE